EVSLSRRPPDQRRLGDFLDLELTLRETLRHPERLGLVGDVVDAGHAHVLVESATLVIRVDRVVRETVEVHDRAAAEIFRDAGVETTDATRFGYAFVERRERAKHVELPRVGTPIGEPPRERRGEEPERRRGDRKRARGGRAVEQERQR